MCNREKRLTRVAVLACTATSLTVAPGAASATGLDELRDIHLPPALPGFQPAPLWWLLLFAVLTAVLVIVIKRRQRRQAANPVFQARQQLDNQFKQWLSDNNRVTYLHNTAFTLKQLAVHSTSRKTTARLSGGDWISWLNKQSVRPLGSIGEKALTVELYQSNPSTDINELHQALSTWLHDYGNRPHA